MIYFEIEKCDQKEPRFNSVYSRSDQPEIKDEAYAKHFDEHKSIRTHWIPLRVNGDKMTYFDSFGVRYISKQYEKFIENKNIATNIYRILAYDSVMCGFVGLDLLILC